MSGADFVDATYESNRPIHLEDLSGIIEIILLVGYFTALYQVHHHELTVSSMAHGLSLIFLAATAGHYFEKTWLDEGTLAKLLMKRYPYFWQSVGCCLVSVLLIILWFWRCALSEFDCCVGDGALSHAACRRKRLKAYAPVFMKSAVFVYTLIGFRLNYVIGGSVLTPNGGSQFWGVLKSPPQLAAIFIASCCSVALYAMLTEAEGRQLYQTGTDLTSKFLGSLDTYPSSQPEPMRQDSESVYSGISSLTGPPTLESQRVGHASVGSAGQGWQKRNSGTFTQVSEQTQSELATPSRYNSPKKPLRKTISPMPEPSSMNYTPSPSAHLWQSPDSTPHPQATAHFEGPQSENLQSALEQQLSQRNPPWPPLQGAGTAGDNGLPWHQKLSVSTGHGTQAGSNQTDPRFATFSRVPSFQRGPGDVSHLISSDSESSVSSFSSDGSGDPLDRSISSLPTYSRRNSFTDNLPPSQFQTPTAQLSRTHQLAFFDSSKSNTSSATSSVEGTDSKVRSPLRRRRVRNNYSQKQQQSSFADHNDQMSGFISANDGGSSTDEEPGIQHHLGGDSTREEPRARQHQGFTGASFMQNYNEVSEKVKEKEKNPWVEYFDETSGSTYYYNEITGDSSWEVPTGLQHKKDS